MFLCLFLSFGCRLYPGFSGFVVSHIFDAHVFSCDMDIHGRKFGMMKLAQFMFSIVYVWAQPRDFHLTPKLFIMPRSEASSESSSSDERTEEVAIAKTENITIDKKTKEERIDEKREVKTKEKVNRVKGDKDGKDDKSKSKMRRSDDKKRRGRQDGQEVR